MYSKLPLPAGTSPEEVKKLRHAYQVQCFITCCSSIAAYDNEAAGFTCTLSDLRVLDKLLMYTFLLTCDGQVYRSCSVTKSHYVRILAASANSA